MTSRREQRERWFYALMACFCAGALTDGLLRARFDRPHRGERYDLADPAVASDAPSDVAPGSFTNVTPGFSRAEPSRTEPNRVAPTTGELRIAPAPLPAARAIDELQNRNLRVPVDGATVEAMKGDFDERRGGRPHEAVDILVPRNTPIHAVQAGTIAKLFLSKAGGTTIYQFDPGGQFCYYYAHLTVPGVSR